MPSALPITDFDYLEFAVQDLDSVVAAHLKFGFQKSVSREILERSLKSQVLTQNGITLVFSQSTNPKDPMSRFVATHGDGIYNVAFLCTDALQTFETAVNRGATMASSPRSFQKEFGKIEEASIRAFGDVLHTFVTRSGNLLGEGFDSPYFTNRHPGIGFTRIDHLTTNVEVGKLQEWADWYEKIFGFQVTRYFDIQTGRTGLYSKVLESPDRVVKMPFNEPSDSQSQIQEYLDINHGAGIQHVALACDSILSTVPQLTQNQVSFLEAPPLTYYEALKTRVPQVSEDINTLRALGILVDGDQDGYLLQIFTQNTVGPFFYEAIQRKGNQGFGEGNFQALFESIERDQIRRGVLKA